MADTPTNATEYLKSLLGRHSFEQNSEMNDDELMFLEDFAAEKIPPKKHSDTPCKYH